MQKVNIIQRRDLEPLWHKAIEVNQHYEKASNCIASVLGADFASVEYSKRPNALLFCTLCKKHCRSASKLPPHRHPCFAMHLDSVREGWRLGGSYVYTCPLGFLFLTSSFFSGERFAGALISSGGIAVNGKQQLLEKTFATCEGEISRAEISGYIDVIPERDNEEIKALAQLMMLCTKQISSHESSLDGDVEHNGIRICPSNIMEQERSLIANLRRGDNGEARKIMQELMSSFNTVSSGSFERFKLKVIELVVVLSRAGANSENSEELIEANNRYLKRIEDSTEFEELVGNMGLILEWMAGKIFSFQGVRHASALRKAERFICENFTRKISLKEVADVSGLSAPYFSTIFKDEMGENFSNYLNRLRVEKASSMLRETEHPISGISTACGFEDQSWFSKIFKSYTGFTPCKYREHGGVIIAEHGSDIKQVS